ncbi:hypothetical protein FQZ97_764970 [compost metagenome]
MSKAAQPGQFRIAKDCLRYCLIRRARPSPVVIFAWAKRLVKQNPIPATVPTFASFSTPDAPRWVISDNNKQHGYIHAESFSGAALRTARAASRPGDANTGPCRLHQRQQRQPQSAQRLLQPRLPRGKRRAIQARGVGPGVHVQCQVRLYRGHRGRGAGTVQRAWPEARFLRRPRRHRPAAQPLRRLRA